MSVYFKSVAIITVQARTSANPHKPLAIFINAINSVIRKAISNIQPRKLIMVILRIYRANSQQTALLLLSKLQKDKRFSEVKSSDLRQADTRSGEWSFTISFVCNNPG